MGESVLIHVDEAARIGTLTLNRPELHNAFDDAMIAQLTGALRAVEADRRVRVVVLAANGKSFSAGADLNWMKRMAGYSEAENQADAAALAELMRTFDRLAKPTVAQLQGSVFAGGLGLVACADIAIAAEGVQFAVTEVRLGLIPAVISPYLVTAIGARAARRYFLTAERFDAREARRLGLVHAVVPPAELTGTVRRFAAMLVEAGPHALAACKALIRDVSRVAIDDSLVAETARRVAAIRVSPEGKEGIAAFLAKGQPGWRR